MSTPKISGEKVGDKRLKWLKEHSDEAVSGINSACEDLEKQKKVGEIESLLKRMEKYSCPNIQGCNCLVVEMNVKEIRKMLVVAAEGFPKIVEGWIPTKSSGELDWETLSRRQDSKLVLINNWFKNNFAGLRREEASR